MGTSGHFREEGDRQKRSELWLQMSNLQVESKYHKERDLSKASVDTWQERELEDSKYEGKM